MRIKINLHSTYLKEVFILLKPYRINMILALFFLILSTLLSIYQPLLLGNLINIIIDKNWDTALKLLVLFLILMIFIGVLNVIYKYLNGLIAARMGLNIRNIAFKGILSKSSNKFNKEKKGKFITNMEDDINEFISIITQKFTIILDLIKVIIVGIVLLKINWILALIMFISFPITSFMFLYFGKKLSHIEFEFKNKKDIYNNFLQESFVGFLIIKVFSIEGLFLNNFKMINEEIFKVSMKQVRLNAKTSLIGEFVNVLLYIIFGIVAFYEIFNGNLSIGIFVAFNSYASTFNNSLYNITKMNSEIQRCLVSIKRILSLINNESDSIKLISNYQNTNCISEKEIIINDLSFEYSDENIVFTKFNLDISPGKIVGLIGENGTGKSTLLKLIMGINKEYKGDIYIKNMNVKEMNSNELSSYISYITQDNFLFSMSIRENLILDNVNISYKKMREVCKMVGIDERIEKLPYKYETILKDNNVNLSGGEVQRICIARALLRDVDIYLFDEITSAIDIDSKKLILKVINNLRRENKTIVIAAHDNEIFSCCDRLIYLNKKVEENNYGNRL